MSGGSDRGRDVQRMVAPGMAAPMRGPLARLGPPGPPPEDDGATLDLLRYAQATDVRPAADLAARVKRRIEAEPPPSRSRWHAAIAALRGRAEGQSSGHMAADTQLGRAPLTAAPRSRALGAAVVALMVLGGGAATGLAASHLLSPARTEDGSLVPRPHHFVEGMTLPASHAPSEPPAVPLTDPTGRGLGPAGAATSSAPSLGAELGPVPVPLGPEPPPDDLPGDDPTDEDDPMTEPGRGHDRPDHRGRGPDGAESNGPNEPPNGPKPREPRDPPNGPKDPQGPKDPPAGPKPREPHGPKDPPAGPKPREPHGPKDPPNGPKPNLFADESEDEPNARGRGRRSD